MTDDRKTSVARAFATAAPKYDAVAQVQRHVATRLAGMLTAAALPAGTHAVEIGCGTGLLTERLLAAQPSARWLITDIASTMVEHCARRCGPSRAEFRVMDGEAPDLAPASCDLIVSSLAMQWFTDLEAGLARLGACLTPGGRLVFATLGADTFIEWRSAHAELGLASGTPALPTAERLQSLWPAGGCGWVHEERITVHHPNGRGFVHDLKALGAHLPRPGHRPVPPGTFRRVLGRFATGCPATYHVLYGSFERDRP